MVYSLYAIKVDLFGCLDYTHVCMLDIYNLVALRFYANSLSLLTPSFIKQVECLAALCHAYVEVNQLSLQSAGGSIGRVAWS